MARSRSAAPTFDPRALIAALERHRVDYVIVGTLARVLHGTAETTDELDITPSVKERNLQRLDKVLTELAPAGGVDVLSLARPEEAVTRVLTAHGTLAIVPEPAGTRGYEDLKRTASREHLGQSLRPQVASMQDLGRMLNALNRPADPAKLRGLRRAEEVQVALGRGLGR